MIALGIDPGSRRTGWGLVSQEGSQLRMLDVGVIRPPEKQPLQLRLAQLHADLSALLEAHRPGLVGMETVFHGPNTRSLVTLGQARGALMTAVGAARCELIELAPAEVKKAVTGNGNATKDQVAHMVGAMLGAVAVARGDEFGKAGRLDAMDALAVALAALHRRSQPAALQRR
jgi:crossover junction endodeoxyribonuclease RuvC